jgi:hypothetical protein
MTNIQNLSLACGQRFAFLTTDLGFHCVEDIIEDWGFEKRYRGIRAGVVLCFEVREFYLYVKVCRLIEGELPLSVGEISASSEINAFDLDDVVTLRSKQSLVPQYSGKTRFDSALFDRVVNTQAENLRLYAGDILSGDFSSFEELAKIVKSRARDAAIRKWGARAVEFGWTL